MTAVLCDTLLCIMPMTAVLCCPLVCSMADNASTDCIKTLCPTAGSLPKIMVYICCHPAYGTRAFYLFHGAKHGGKACSKTGQGKMYEGFTFWHHGLTAADIEHIKSMSYYASDKTLDAFEKRVGAAVRGAMQEDEFNPCYFLVRPYSQLRHFSASSS